jgi:hypothetical protein
MQLATPKRRGRRLPAPTPFPPGSPGKVLELCRRYEARLPLWHPNDARFRDADREAERLKAIMLWSGDGDE